MLQVARYSVFLSFFPFSFYGKSTNTSPFKDRRRFRRMVVIFSSLSVEKDVLYIPPIIIRPPIRSVDFACTNFRNAGVNITGPVAHFVPIPSACKLNNIFCIAEDADAYFV